MVIKAGGSGRCKTRVADMEVLQHTRIFAQDRFEIFTGIRHGTRIEMKTEMRFAYIGNQPGCFVRSTDEITLRRTERFDAKIRIIFFCFLPEITEYIHRNSVARLV